MELFQNYWEFSALVRKISHGIFFQVIASYVELQAAE